MSLTNVFSNLSTKKKIIVCAGALAVVAATVLCIVFARSGYIATTMRLLKIEGTVNLEDSKGGAKPVIDNIRFQSGDALSTGADGLASVGLDNTKIITLQNDSRAEFTKKNKQLELKLTKGSVFFNVTEKLKSDEKFEIKTATMTAGIRGTSGMVYYDAKDGGREALLITDGKVEVTAKNPKTGEIKTTMVKSGQSVKVYLFNDRKKDSVAFQLDNVTLENLPKTVAKRIAENDALTRRVCDANNWDQNKLKKQGAAEPKKVSETDPITTTTAAPEETTTVPETTQTSKPAETSAPSETTTETTETSETTTEPSPTPSPTATPTPKPTATPTPTKKPTPKHTATTTTATTTTEATTTTTEATTTTTEATTTTTEATTTTTEPESDLPALPSGYKKYYLDRDARTQKVEKYIAYSHGSKGLLFAGYDTSKKIWVSLIRNAEISGGKQYEEFIERGTLSFYVGLSGNNIFPTLDDGNTAGVTVAPSGSPAIPDGYYFYLRNGDSNYGTFASATTGMYICIRYVHSSSSHTEFKVYYKGSWYDITRTSIWNQSGTIYEYFECPNNITIYLTRYQKELLMPDELSLYPYRTYSRARAAVAATTAPSESTESTGPADPTEPAAPTEPAETIEPSAETHAEAARDEPTAPIEPSDERAADPATTSTEAPPKAETEATTTTEAIAAATTAGTTAGATAVTTAKPSEAPTTEATTAKPTTATTAKAKPSDPDPDE